MDNKHIRIPFHYNFHYYLNRIEVYLDRGRLVPFGLIQMDMWLNRMYNLMAKADASRKKNNFGDIEFAAIKLNDADKDDFSLWIKDANNGTAEDIAELVVMGWKLSTTWDNYNDCFIASFTQRGEKDRNYNVCVTSRSDDITEAMMLGVWKIAVKFKDAKIPTEAIKDNWG